MNIVILNANPDPTAPSLDRYVAELCETLSARGTTVRELRLRDLDLRDCVGCFGCWVKTPGACVVSDESHQVAAAVIASDFTLWAAPMKMGFPSALLKRTLDKSIPLVHPYFEVVNHESHHKPRYRRYPRFGLLLEPEVDTNDQDLRLTTELLTRTTLNLKSKLAFSATTRRPVADLASEIMCPTPTALPLPASPGPTQGTQVQPIRHLTLFNGSPRGRRGNTPILLGQLAQGFEAAGGDSETYHLNRRQEAERMVRAFAEAECVWLGFPLYTDAMPGLVKTFIEELAPLRGRQGNPPIGFLVQSGFPESAHSRYVERYLETLAARLGSPYLGTIVKGGGEGVRLLPEPSNRRLFEQLRGLGNGLALTGRLDAATLRAIASPERYSMLLAPLFHLFVRTPWATWYWDMQLKRNGAFDRRDDRPFGGDAAQPDSSVQRRAP